MEDILKQLQGNGHLLLSAYQNTLDLRRAMCGDIFDPDDDLGVICSEGNELARKIKTKLSKGVCHHASSLECGGEDYTGGETDALDDATGMILDYLDKIVEGTDKSVLVQDLKPLNQQILLDPEDYDHLTGAWHTMTHIDCEGKETPVKKILEAIFNQIERYLETYE